MTTNSGLTTCWTLLTSLSQLTTTQRAQIFQHSECPFNHFEFLTALEKSGSVGEQSGWLPRYFLYQDEQQIGLLIGYEKHHSYGEYVFDWAWADAYHRHNIRYYPKFVAAIPFSPVPCSKWLSNTNWSELEALEQIKQLDICEEYSGFHLLFTENNHVTPWIQRCGHQFHWFNKDEKGNLLTSFEQYLSLMTARKRKNIVKERAKVVQSGFTFEWRQGNEVTQLELETFYRCYQQTYLKRGQTGYLTLSFFEQIFKTMSEQICLLVCIKQQTVMACALYLKSTTTLYGRYWGSLTSDDNLHFEACYYQGIEFAIKHQLISFNPGTQGEHKIARGFEPITTYSYHQLELAPFHQAVTDFCQQEKTQNEIYMAACAERLPFKSQK